MASSNRQFSYQDELSYYAQPPERYPGYDRLLPYLKLLHADPGRLFASKRILDLGAGECAFTGLIAEQLQPAAIVALELIRSRMIPAKRFLRSDRLHFVQGSCYELPFPDGYFDLVFGDLVLHHLPRLPLAVSEIRRVLTPGGSYVGLEPNFLNPVRLALSVWGGGSRNEHVLWPRVIRGAFRAQGFGSVEIGYVWHRFPKLRNSLLASEMAIRAS